MGESIDELTQCDGGQLFQSTAMCLMVDEMSEYSNISTLN